MSLVFLILNIFILALSLMPGIISTYLVLEWTESWTMLWRCIAISLSLSGCYIIHQITLPLLCGIVFQLLPIRYPEGEFRLHSRNGVKWAACTALHRLSRQHFPMYSLPSWYVNFYYRLMGANIAKGAHIATLMINDPQHVSISKGSLIGGGAIINSHSVEGGMLIIAKNIIGSNVTIGLNSVLLAGACVEDSAIIGARSLVTKHKVVPSGEKWVGTPAKRMD
jgi:serine acetyltransferase